MTLHVVLDKNEEGYYKVTKSDHYRFSVVIADDDAKPILTIQGFRCDRAMQHILPPSVGSKWGAFQLATLSREWEGKILAYLSRKLYPDDPELMAAGLAPEQPSNPDDDRPR